MKIKTELLKKDSGQVIMFILFVVLFLVLFVSLFISKNLLRQAKVSSSVVSSVQAYYIADTGTENALFYLSENEEYSPGVGSSVPINGNLFTPLGGTVRTKVSAKDEGANTLTIDVLGTYKNTSRAIQLFW